MWIEIFIVVSGELPIVEERVGVAICGTIGIKTLG
jgi:hypothetical protein